MITAIIFIVFPSLIVQTFGIARVPYGGQCNETAKCDTRAWLRCLDGTCSCLKPEEMIYEGHSGKCVAKAGEHCLYSVGGSDPSASFSEVHPCVRNANCNPDDGVCICNEDFYESPQGTCEPTGLYGEYCDGTATCSKLMGLICNQNGMCSCDESNSEFSPERNQCVGLAGSQCIQGACTDNANCSTNMCTCDKGFYWWNTEGKCLPKIEIFGRCSNDYQCKQSPGMELKCVNGGCNCDPATSVYASVRPSEAYCSPSYGFRGYEGNTFTRCVPLPQSPCKDRLCAPRSYCEYASSYDFNSGVCKCEPGLTLSRNGKSCARGLGGNCTVADECIDGLVCKNQVCSCEFALQDFDKNTRSCRSRYRGPCVDDMECTTNSYCEIQESGAGHCVCDDTHVAGADDFCRVPHGGLCEKSSDCDDMAALECVNNICVCGSFNSFQSYDRKCLGRVGARCGSDDKCISNAHCHKAYPKSSGHCMCDGGFREAGDYTCWAIGQAPASGFTEETTTVTTTLPW